MSELPIEPEPDRRSASQFWNVNLGHVLNMIWIAVVIGIAWGNVQSRLDTMTRDLTAQSILVDKIDSRGTRFDSERIAEVHVTILEHERRLARVEDALPILANMRDTLSELSRSRVKN